MPNYQTVSVNQTPGNGTDYPFVAPTTAVQYLLGDLFLSYIDDSCDFRPPFRVVWMAGFGSSVVANPSAYTSTHARDIVIVDANDVVVFDSTLATDYSENDWGTELYVCCWQYDSNVLRLTRHTIKPDGTTLTASTPNYIAADVELDPRTYTRQPRKVTGIRVGLDLLQEPYDNVLLQEGYNIRLQVDPEVVVDGGRRVRQIRIRAQGGDGAGLVPACLTASRYINRINATSPTDAGNFKLTTNGCYRLQRPVEVVSNTPRTVKFADPALTDEEAASALKLYNDCAPCCDCMDFVRTYEGIRRVWNRYLELGDRAETIRDQYAINIERWNNQKACRDANVPKLILIGEPGSRVFIGGSFCNTTTGCIGPVVLRLTLETFRGGGPFDCTAEGGARVKCRENRRIGSDTGDIETVFDLVGAYPIYDVWFDKVAPQSAISFKTRLIMNCYNDITLDQNTMVQATLSVHSPDPTDPVTGRALDFPAAAPTVPASVAALWTGISPAPYPVRGLTIKTASYGLIEGCRSCP